MNTDELESAICQAERRVLEIQTKLHRWAGEESHRRFDDLYNLVAAGRWPEAQDLHYYLMTLNDAIFMEINPVPVKTALGLMGKISPEVRLPLSSLSPANYERLQQILTEYGLISP